ncbi:MAG: HAMP domain-containing sensor histidine kinase [Actinomycetota bacterium]|nr:HAMP domain-containing sensor histidine kinase [Actinomycetota bacterium]
MSIRLRLALVVALITTVLVATGGVVSEAVLSSGMRATLQDDLRRNAARLVNDLETRRLVLGAAAPVVDPSRDQSVLQVVTSNGHVGYTTVRAGTTSMLSGPERARAGARRIYVVRDRAGWRSPRLLLAEPAPAHPGWLIVVGASLDELDDTTARLELLLVGGGAALVVVATAGGYLLAGRALRPVDRLRAEAEEISATLPSRRLATPTTRDELARLAETLNRLLDRLQGTLSRQREFVAVASHELRTPLAVLQAELEMARRPGRSVEELRGALEVLGPRVDQLARLADDLLLLARGDEGALGMRVVRQPLEPIVAQSLASLSRVAEARGVALALDADGDVAAPVDAGRFQQVVENLVENSLEHAVGGRLVAVHLREEADHAVLEVRDEGPGFAPDVLPRAFERFTRAEAPARRGGRRGAGLGLAIARLVVEAHGGSVEARNRAAGGACVVVRLPVSPAGADGSPEVQQGAGKSTRGARPWTS